MQVLDPINSKVLHFPAKAAALDDPLDAQLAVAGMAQNRGKQEVVLLVQGPVSTCGTFTMEMSKWKGLSCAKLDIRETFTGTMDQQQMPQNTGFKKLRLRGPAWVTFGQNKAAPGAPFACLPSTGLQSGLVPYVLCESDYVVTDAFITGLPAKDEKIING